MSTGVIATKLLIFSWLPGIQIPNFWITRPTFVRFMLQLPDALCILANNVNVVGMQKLNFRLYVSHPQGSVLPWHEYVSGSNVHLLLVLCYCGHGHRWDDLQIY